MSFSQLVTLMFGFLLASVMIFVFGLWVGRDISGQDQADPWPVVHKSVEPAIPAADGRLDPLPTKTARFVLPPPIDRPTRPRLSRPTASRTRTREPTTTATSRRRGATPAVTPTRPVAPTPVPRHRSAEPTTAAGAWTVQVTATNDQIQALVIARGLRSKGFEAFTSQTEVAGTTWYRIQVGQFADKKAAERTAARLRRQGMEAAFVEHMR